MKGKIAFVLGAAVGYVLGSRAGRQRYEQIKRGAQTLWETSPVQQGVGVVRDALDDCADEIKAYMRRASSDAFTAFARRASGQTGSARDNSSETANGSGAARQASAGADPGPVGAEVTDGGPDDSSESEETTAGASATETPAAPSARSKKRSSAATSSSAKRAATTKSEKEQS